MKFYFGRLPDPGESIDTLKSRPVNVAIYNSTATLCTDSGLVIATLKRINLQMTTDGITLSGFELDKELGAYRERRWWLGVRGQK